MATDTAATSELSTQDGVRRRDWIHIAALSTAGVGGASILFPLVSQMAPSADVLALSTTEIDISAIQPGQAIKTSWRKQPVFVRNLVAKEIAEAKAVPKSAFEAYKWLALAERWNVQVPPQAFEQLARELKPEEIEKAKAAAVAYTFKTK